jgi:hypothetical protein
VDLGRGESCESESRTTLSERGRRHQRSSLSSLSNFVVWSVTLCGWAISDVFTG